MTIKKSFKEEVFKFLKWVSMVLGGMLGGVLIVWTLHLGYKWPTAVVCVVVTLLALYLTPGWTGYEITIWGRNSRK